MHLRLFLVYLLILPVQYAIETAILYIMAMRRHPIEIVQLYTIERLTLIKLKGT